MNEPTTSPTYLMVAMTHSLPIMHEQLNQITEGAWSL